MIRRSRGAFAVGVVAAVLVIGCGGDDGAGDAGPERDRTTDESAAEPPPSDPSVVDDTASTSGDDTSAPDTTASSEDVRPAADLVLPDPAVGLGSLASYHQELSVDLAGPDIAQTDSYVRDAWPGRAVFTTTTSSIDGAATEFLLGDLVSPTGTTTVSRATGDPTCRTTWTAGTTPVVPTLEPAQLLPPVLGFTAVATETIEGMAATRYVVEVGVGGARGTGEVVLAADRGTVLSYAATLVEGDVTSTYRYALSSLGALGALGEPVLPEGCAPVLERIPTVDGATDVQRLPGVLDYSTGATVADVVVFHEQTLPTLGWTWVTTQTPTAERATMLFDDPATGETASILVESVDGRTWVNILVRATGG